LELAMLLAEPGELRLEPGELLAVGLLAGLERPAELRALGAKPIALGAELVHIVNRPPRLLEFFAEPGELLAVGLLSGLERSAELRALGAKPIALGPIRLVALGEPRPKLLSRVQSILPFPAQPVLLPTGSLESRIALMELLSQRIAFGMGGCELRTPLVEFVGP
jgi:hypothetical protein